MEKLTVKYATASRALPPQRIKLELPGWGGDVAQRMVDGSAVQPWHCQPFVEGNTYGLELVYQHEQECQVINDGPAVRIEWDFYKEPGGDVTGGEFMTFFPKEAPQQYLFSTRIDLQAPPGYVARIEPHPRFFTDTTGTVPVAIIANVQTEWWTKWFFVVFKVPAPGQRHVFRKGEPFAQVIFVPQRVGYDIVRMTDEEHAARREAARQVDVARNEIGTNVWVNASGGDQANHYKVLSAAFARDGRAGVDKVIADAMARRQEQLPTADEPIAETLAKGAAQMAEHRYAAARDVFMAVLAREPHHAEALANYGICLTCLGSTVPGLRALAHAAALEPHVPARHNSLGEMLRLLERYPESEAAFRNSLRLNPNNPSIHSVLSLVVARQGRLDEALQIADRVLTLSPNSALAHLRKGLLLEQAGRPADAGASIQIALKLDPDLPDAQAALARVNTQAPTAS